MMSELEGRAGATAATSNATELNDATRSAAALDDAASNATGLKEAAGGAAELNEAEVGAAELTGAATAAESDGATVAVTAMPSAAQPAATAAEARDAPPVESPPWEGARVRDSLEAIKTAVVWLVVLQILTILSPLLRVSIKWALIVGVALTLGTFAVGGVAYLKARRMQDGFPE